MFITISWSVEGGLSWPLKNWYDFIIYLWVLGSIAVLDETK